MTTPSGPILFNNSTGSDTAASGVGPATAITGSAASYSSTTVTLDGSPDLSGVSAGDFLYMVTSTGRRFFVIATVNDGADQVTVDDAPSGTASGLSWAIGGKRATLDHAGSRYAVSDNKSDWIIELEYTGTNYTISSLMPTPASYLYVRGDGGATRPTVELTFNGYAFAVGTSDALFEDLIAINTNATKTASAFFRSGAVSGVSVTMRRCLIGSATSSERFWKAMIAAAINNELYIKDCKFLNCVSHAIEHHVVFAERCVIDSCGSDGVAATVNSTHVWLDSIFSNNTGDGIDLSVNSADHLIFKNCHFYNNGGDGIQTSGFGAGVFLVSGCIFVGNGGYGRQHASEPTVSFEDYNAYYNNTSGEKDGGNGGDNDITLTASPYVDAASDDFNINDTAGGGAVLRGTEVTL